MLLKSRESLTCFRACFLPDRAKDLSAPRYVQRCVHRDSNLKDCKAQTHVKFSGAYVANNLRRDTFQMGKESKTFHYGNIIFYFILWREPRGVQQRFLNPYRTNVENRVSSR